MWEARDKHDRKEVKTRNTPCFNAHLAEQKIFLCSSFLDGGSL